MHYKKCLLSLSVLSALTLAGCKEEETQLKAVDESAEQVSIEQEVQATKTVEQVDNRLQAILTGEHRSDANKARDQYRHPAETLEFFGIKPGMTVVEIAPGGGWYTEILAPWLGAEGTLYAAHFDPDSEIEYYRNSRRKFEEKLAASPELYGNVKLTVFDPTSDEPIAPANSADAVVTFRNVHNWMRGGRGDALNAFKKMYAALKPGGVLGVVEHRLATSLEQDAKASSGYMHEEYVIGLVEEAGFKLVERSQINANPKDTSDHPKGVWTLPPSLRLGDEDREKYLEIGESDRMTLKFVKPAVK